MTLEVPTINASSGLRVLFIGDAKPLGFDFSDSRAVTAGASLSSAAITIDSGGYYTAGSPSVASNIATATFTGVSAGTALVKCVGTMSTGALVTIVGTVKVVDPLDETTW